MGNSVAETDDRLDKYFVDTHTFKALITGQKDIVAGDKGTGKTALYRILLKRQKSIEQLRTTKILTAFNLTGSPIFQELLGIPQLSEGQYIAFWKTYFLSLVGNWLIDDSSLPTSRRKRVQYFLDSTGLRTIDTTPKGVFSKLIDLFPKTPVKGLEMDMGMSESGLPHLKPKVEFSDAQAAVPPRSFFGVDYPTGLQLLDASLRDADLVVWIAMDRLDEAFQGFLNVEIPALRALLRTYLDFKELTHVRPKLFLRKDLFRRIISDPSGSFSKFVNLTHINDQKVEIEWEEDDLKFLLIARMKDSPNLVRELGLQHCNIDQIFDRVFPAKISHGEKQMTTWRWMLSRIRDGNDVIAPRNLIDLIEKAREAQLRSENRIPREYSRGMPLIVDESLRKAHNVLSKTRTDDTLLAENADLAPLLERFRNNKPEYQLNDLCLLFGLPEDEVRKKVKELRDLGAC